MTYTIKRISVNEAGLLANLIAELLYDFNVKSGNSNFVIDKAKIETVCKELLPRENFGAFIAFDTSNNPAGMITIAQATAIYNGGDFGVITELYVDRNIRSQGLGKLLIETGLEFSRSQKWQKVEVGAPNKTDWPRTIDFYLKNGFEEKGPKLRINL